MPKLVTIQGAALGREYDLGEISFLGRSPSCQIYIGDLKVSREHARISLTESGFILADLGSGNGTWVNGERVNRHLLRPGDEIRISEHVFRFEQDPQPRGQGAWIDLVTVMSGHEDGLVSTGAVPRFRYFDTDPGQSSSEELATLLSRARRMLEALYNVAGATSSLLDPQRLFDQLLDYLLNVFPDAQLGYIMLKDERGQLVPRAIRRPDGQELSGGSLVVSQSVINRVLERGEAVLSTPGDRVMHDTSPYGMPAAKMCAPLEAQEEVHGIVHIEGRVGGRVFTKEDLDLLTGIARIAAVAIVNAALHERLMRQQRLEQDLRFAQKVQQSFLPASLPSMPGYRFSRRYNPLFDVGGDFYDLLPLPDGQMGVTIGDVSGKGVSAALLMARLTSDIRFFGIAEQQPTRVLQRANHALLASAQDNMFATVLYLTLAPDGTMALCNAGHVPPVVRRASGEVQLLDDATSLALGVLEDTLFEQVELQLAPGDALLLCTDGLVEAKDPHGEEFGFERMQQAMAQAAPHTLLDDVLRQLAHFTGPTDQYDDLTLVAILREG